MSRICVLGLGYIGLPTACLLATHGHQVLGVDLRADLVENVNESRTAFREPGLGDLIAQARSLEKLVADTEPEPSDIFVIAVPTPIDKDVQTADLGYLRQAVTSVSKYLREGNLVVLESTVPPGTCQRLVIPILEASSLQCDRDFYLAYCPERAIPGNTIHEMIHDNRVIGADSNESAVKARELYSSFVSGSLSTTNLCTAETIKLMENAYRDVNIALVNEFARIAEENRIDVWEAIEIANKHPRVRMLKPGPGVGGHCLAIDPWFLTESSGVGRIIPMAREINYFMAKHTLKLVISLVADIKNPIISVLGAAYKGDVDDVRESPTLRFIKLAENEGFKIRVFDPLVVKFEYELMSFEDTLRGSDCLVLMTDHSCFRQIEPRTVSSLLRNRNLVDTRNLLNHKEWREAGFRIKVIGNGLF